MDNTQEMTVSELEDARARIKLLERSFEQLGIAMDALRDIATESNEAPAARLRWLAQRAIDRTDRVSHA